MIVFTRFTLDSKVQKVKAKTEFWLTFKDDKGARARMEA
jgi:hypothetical protein